MESTQAAAFEAVALPHLDAVYRMARRLAATEAEAEDLVQETFVKALRAFDRFELREFGAKPWLLRILHNTYYSQRQRTGRQPSLLDDVDFDIFSGELDAEMLDRLPGEIEDWESFDEEIKRAVQQLAPEYRNVLLLWAFEDLTYKEIASICDCKVGTVMSRLYRARQLVSQKLANYVKERNVSSRRDAP